MQNDPPYNDEPSWQLAIQGVVPLKNKKPKISKPKAGGRVEVSQVFSPPPLPIEKNGREFIEIGDTSRIDGQIARKLREGSYNIDYTLDLHGKTQEIAFTELKKIIEESYYMGRRCILVITGKGVAGWGVLRQQLPKWLSAPGLKEYILTITTAKQQHGGTGAFYVLLRKNRIIT